MLNATATELSLEQRREVAAWIEKNSARVPEPVRIFLTLHQQYLTAGADLRKPFDAAWRELRRALGITPSSERRKSGSPLACIPPRQAGKANDERTLLLHKHERSFRLSG